ncbi:hypothetical protein ASF98_09760 [Arthrobacter sp. Leaf337]|uniref:hypothetical protein n=1 Tax=Arthrobacter sp. Leaf337 TaxID=1736342 RepID=UPI000701EE15|nr:hypothetical protein [Arthrobacter sp. Leaf337]KQR65400.1 hypothetical protein ASF98_09760 [Arthrobacter sp. Leaf337]
MEQSTSILINNSPLVAEGGFHPETHARGHYTVVNLHASSSVQRALLRSQISCVALVFAALLLAGAYILIPLAMAVHFAVHPVLLSVTIAAALLTELALLVTFIVLKTEKPSE